MSVFQSIPEQGLASLSGVDETELGPVPTGWRWGIDIATSVVDDTVRLAVEHWHDNDDDQHQDIEIFLSRAEFTELLARLFAARDVLEARAIEPKQETP